MLIDVLLPIGLLIVVAKLVEGALSRFGLSSIIAFTADRRDSRSRHRAGGADP